MKNIKMISLFILAFIISFTLVSCKTDGDAHKGENIKNNTEKAGENVQENLLDSNILNLDIFEAVDVVYTGINNYGEMRVIFDGSPVKSAEVLSYVQGIFGSEFNTPNSLLDAEFYDLFDIEIITDKEFLSNGDIVTLKVVLEDTLIKEGETIESASTALGIKLAKTQMTHTVFGLEDGVLIDAYEIVKEHVNFVYGEGCGTLEFNIPDDFSYEIEGLYLTRSEWYNNVLNLSYNNQLVATISLHPEESNGTLKQDMNLAITMEKEIFAACDVNYYVLPQTSVKVPFLGKYIESADDLSTDNIDEILTYANYCAEKQYGEGKYTIEGIYLGTIKPETVILYDNPCYQKCNMVVVVSYKGFVSEGVSSLSLLNKAFYLKEGGTLNFPISKWDGNWTGSYSSHYNNDPSNSSSLNDDYTYERIYVLKDLVFSYNEPSENGRSINVYKTDKITSWCCESKLIIEATEWQEDCTVTKTYETEYYKSFSQTPLTVKQICQKDDTLRKLEVFPIIENINAYARMVHDPAGTLQEIGNELSQEYVEILAKKVEDDVDPKKVILISVKNALGVDSTFSDFFDDVKEAMNLVSMMGSDISNILSVMEANINKDKYQNILNSYVDTFFLNFTT